MNITLLKEFFAGFLRTRHLALFINGFTKGGWMEALLFALSIAVGLTPEMLPMILLAYMGLTQAMKGIYFRRYGWQ